MSNDFIWRFTPSRTNPVLLENVFVQRESLLANLVHKVEESATTGNKHHVLLIGPRGIGKTHLVSLVHHRVTQDQRLSKKLRIAWLNEDETSTSFVQLLARIYRALAEAYRKEFPIETLDELLQQSPDEVERQLKKLLVRDFANKTLLVIVENLDLLFEGLRSEGQKQWRSFLQEHPMTSVIATSQRLFSGVQERTKPFFGFFTPIHLHPLTVSDAVLLLQRIGTENGQDELVDYLQLPEGRSRVRALHHLAGGNHRIYIVLSGFITRDSLEELAQPFEKMADELTPYYQERMRWLSPQQRQIVEFLCTRPSPATPKEIAKYLLAAENTISSQLKKLSELGYVFSQRRGRESLYELCEPLMRLASEVKQRGTLRLLVDFLRIWYRPDRLSVMLQEAQGESLRAHLMAAISACSDSADPRLAAIQLDIDRAKSEGRLDDELNALEENAHATDKARDWYKYGVGLSSAGRFEDAIDCIDRALELVSTHRLSGLYQCFKGFLLFELRAYEEAIHCFDETTQGFDETTKALPEDVFGWHGKGEALYALQRFEKAGDCFDKALEIDSDDEVIWCLKGECLAKQHRHEDALVCFRKSLRIKPDFPQAEFALSASLIAMEKWADGIKLLRDVLQRASGNDEGEFEALVCAVHVTTADAKRIRSLVNTLTDICEKAGLLAPLGRGLVRSLRMLESDPVDNETFQRCRDAWLEVGAGHEELEVSVRIYRVGIEYLITQDERVFLDLLKSERTILRQALGLDAMEPDEREDGSSRGHPSGE